MVKRHLAFILIIITIANVAEAGTFESEDEGTQQGGYDYDEYFQEYFTYESMMDALNRLEVRHPNIMKVYDLTATIDESRDGVPRSTWQGRKVWGIKVSDGVNSEPDYYSDPDEAVVFIVGAHHGSEYTSFEVSLYFLFYLVENYGKEPTDNDLDGKINEDPIDGVDNDGDGLIDEDLIEGRATWLVDNREIWIVPMQNPDGVVADTRKNCRETIPGPFGSNIPTSGVNTNRNYPFMWGSPYDPNTGQTMDTPNPMGSEYRGPKDGFDDDGDSWIREEYRPGIFRWIQDPNNVDEDPVNNIDDDNDGKIDEDPDGGFSEPETIAIRNLVERLDWNDDGRSDIIASISYHTFGEMIIYPWGYVDEPTANDGLFRYIGGEFERFTNYTLMQGPTLYPTSGDTDDWLYGKHNVLAYTLELGTQRKVENAELVKVSMLNLPCNIYIAEMAPVMEIAREKFMDSLDVLLPIINHTQPKKTINSDFTYTVKVDVDNAEYLMEDSLNLYYRVGTSGEWKKKLMKDMGDDQFQATIPRQNGGRDVYYYIQGEAHYSQAVSQKNGIIRVFSPKYGASDPYSYFVDISLGDTAGAIASMILMMALIFGIIYTGLGKSLKMAIDAEKRKGRI